MGRRIIDVNYSTILVVVLQGLLFSLMVDMISHWWLVVGGWWLVIIGWWLVANFWWLVVCHYSLVVGGDGGDHGELWEEMRVVVQLLSQFAAALQITMM